MEKILKASYTRVRALLERNRSSLDRLAAALVRGKLRCALFPAWPPLLWLPQLTPLSLFFSTARAPQQLEHETLSAEECALAVRGEPIPREKLPTPASAASKSQSAQAQRAQAKSGKKRASSPAPSLVAAEH